MNRTNPEVDECYRKADRWQEEMARLRTILLDGLLTEELKWGKPFYTFQQGNVAVVWGFKDHCALGFCKGALLDDRDGILSKIGENTQAARKVRFTSVREIAELTPVLKAYLEEAIEVEKAGLEVTYKQTADFARPEELQHQLAQAPDLKAAFEALTPGRQRGYILHFSAPKQSGTRTARVEKHRQRILNGLGMHDRPGTARERPAHAA